MEENIIVTKENRKTSPRKKRKKKGFLAAMERFLNRLADASDQDSYEKEIVELYSKKK